MDGIKIDQLTFTRFIAATAIVIFHFGSEVMPFSQEPLKTFFRNANIFVSYFFILSGFIMVIAYSNRKSVQPIKYYQSRFARIYPVYALALLFYIPKMLINLSSFDYSGLILNILMIQAWVPGKALSVNPPGWSLSVEIFFYGLFPLLLILYRKINWRLTGILALVLFLASQALLNLLLPSQFMHQYPAQRHELLFYFPLMHLSEFIAGNVAGFFFINRLSGRNRKNGIPIFFLCIILGVLVCIPIGLNTHNGLLALVFIPLILLLSSDSGLISRIFSMPFFVFLGEISYSIYILQAPLYSLIKRLLGSIGMNDPRFIFYCYLIVLLCAASLSYIYIEKPFRSWINQPRTYPLSKQAV